jgi:hypothetical protein
MDVKFKRLTKPSTEIVEYFHRWENDPTLIPFIRPNKNKEELEERETVTVKDLEQRLEHHQIYLIYLDDQLVGEMDFLLSSIKKRAIGKLFAFQTLLIGRTKCGRISE